MKHSQGNQWSWKNLPDSLTGFMGSHKGDICCWVNAPHMLSCSLSDKREKGDLTKCSLTIRSALGQSTCCVFVAKVAHMGRSFGHSCHPKNICPLLVTSQPFLPFDIQSLCPTTVPNASEAPGLLRGSAKNKENTIPTHLFFFLFFPTQHLRHRQYHSHTMRLSSCPWS